MLTAPAVEPHARWVRATHWITALTVLTLAGSGFWILRVHPRLYWGATGNDLVPAWLELPISPSRGTTAGQQTRPTQRVLDRHAPY